MAKRQAAAAPAPKWNNNADDVKAAIAKAYSDQVLKYLSPFHPDHSNDPLVDVF